MSAHPRPLGHISIGVRNYETSKSFYIAVLAPLGLYVVYDSQVIDPNKSPRTLGFGPDKEQEILNLFERGHEAYAPGAGSHIAFNAPSRTAVIEFHDAALRHGGESKGEPGVRPHYGANYFAAFVIDPDGWKLEAVCKRTDTDMVDDGQ
jgi:catechol 2,3-dioxygenase-like lactoylglutathione lyase family enzyme